MEALVYYDLLLFDILYVYVVLTLEILNHLSDKDFSIQHIAELFVKDNHTSKMLSNSLLMAISNHIIHKI